MRNSFQTIPTNADTVRRNRRAPYAGSSRHGLRAAYIQHVTATAFEESMKTGGSSLCEELSSLFTHSFHSEATGTASGLW